MHRRESLSNISSKNNEGKTETVSKKKVVVKEVNCQKKLAWCREKRRRTVQNNWNKVIFSDESKIMIWYDQRVHIRRKRNEVWRPDLVEPRTSQPRNEVMILGCIPWNGVETITPVNGSDLLSWKYPICLVKKNNAKKKIR